MGPLLLSEVTVWALEASSFFQTTVCPFLMVTLLGEKPFLLIVTTTELTGRLLAPITVPCSVWAGLWFAGTGAFPFFFKCFPTLTTILCSQSFKVKLLILAS